MIIKILWGGLYSFGALICCMNFYNAIGRHIVRAILKKEDDNTNPSGIGLLGQIFIVIGLAGIKPSPETSAYWGLASLFFMLIDMQGIHVYFLIFLVAGFKSLFKRR